MLLTCVRKELLANILSMRYGLTVFLFLALTVASTVVAVQIFRKETAECTRAVSERGAIALMARSWWESLGQGVTVEKRPDPLAIFAAGLENDMTRSLCVNEQGTPDVGFRKLSAPSLRFSLNLDMVAIVNIVCSLLALLLMYDTVCGEREQGTLKVLLAGTVPRDIVILAKFIAGLLTLLVPLALTWALNIVYVALVAHGALTPALFARLAWLMVLGVLYVGFFCALGIAISCWTRRSATSLVVCLFLWAVMVLAAPNLMPMAVKHLSPIPPEAKIVQEKQAINQEVESLWQKKREELGANDKITNIEQLDSIHAVWFDEEYRKREARIDRFYDDRVKRQMLLNERISRISPSTALVFASTHLAGTGAQDFVALLSYVDDYRRQVQEKMAGFRKELDRISQEMQKSGRSFDGPDAPEQMRKPLDPSVWPSFEPRPIALPAALNDCWVDIGVLAAGAVLLFMAAFVGFMRYDPK